MTPPLLGYQGAGFGRGVEPEGLKRELDLLFQLGLFMDAAGTRPRTNCNGRPNKRCTVCPQLFPKLTRCPDNTWTVAADPTQPWPRPCVGRTRVDP